MRKQTARRGFTITELVIVIVVIAILAAVLIPTFASLIKKANQSADIQAARQMDVALQADSAAKKPEALEAVIDILEKAGFDAEGSLKPITKNHKFYWHKTYNVIVLANEEEAATVILYPAKNKDLVNNFAADKALTGDAQVLFDLEKGFRQYVDVTVDSAEAAENALSNGQSTTLTEDIILSKPVAIPEGETTTLDLGGKTMTTFKNEQGGKSDYLNVYGTLILTNGTFNGRGIQVYSGGKLIIGKDANVVVNSVDDNGGAAIWVYAGAEVEINGGKFVAASAGLDYVKSPAALANQGGKITINGGEFICNSRVYAINQYSGEIVINDAKVTAARGAIAAEAGTITVNGGTFAVTSDLDSGWMAYAGTSGKVIINGGQFTTVTNREFSGNVEDNR